MHTYLKYLAPLAAVAASLIACLDTVAPEAPEPIKVDVYASLDEFPDFTKKNEAQEIFAVKESALYICVDKKWKTTGHVVNNTVKVSPNCIAEDGGDTVRVLCEGDTIGVLRDGEKGEKGATGAKGDVGDAGAAGDKGETGDTGPRGDKGDKGADGVDNAVKGEPGDDCSAYPLMEGQKTKGYWIVCGGDTVTTIFNGIDGVDGRGGESTCLSHELEDHSGYKIVCQGDSVGVIRNGADNFSYCDILPLWDGSGTKLSCGIKKTDSLVNVTKYSWDLMNPNIDYGIMVDARDGQPYRTVKIGNQTWMAENLNYADASDYLDTTNAADIDYKSSCYNNVMLNCHKYGRYYRWSAVMDSAKTKCGNGSLCNMDSLTHVQGICPDGWHVPDTTEWKTLIDNVGSWDASAIMSLSGWMNDSGTDTYGFSAYPGGVLTSHGYGYTNYFSEYAGFATSVEYGAEYFYYQEISYTFSANIQMGYKYYYYHVRCVMDE